MFVTQLILYLLLIIIKIFEVSPSLGKGSKKKDGNFHLRFWPPPPPKDGKVEQKNLISRSYGVFTHNWYQRWKIKKKFPDPPLMEISIFFF